MNLFTVEHNIGKLYDDVDFGPQLVGTLMSKIAKSFLNLNF